jgi:ADP-ribose pyrophosphatase
MSKDKSGDKVLYSGKFLRMVSRNGWECVDRVNISGIVAIVAITDDAEIVLVEQHRPPIGKSCIELPAGLAGDLGAEDLKTAAIRELLEETGYEAGKMVELGTGTTSAGMSGEMITMFVATELKKVSDGGGDGSENITVHLVDGAKLPEFLKEKQATCAIDLKVWSGIAMAIAGGALDEIIGR